MSDIIDLFVRINSTGKSLTSGEKRHARFYRSRFLKEAERLVDRYKRYLLSERILSRAQLLRMKGTELVSELLMSIHQGGPINKKTSLDRAIGNESVNGKVFTASAVSLFGMVGIAAADSILINGLPTITGVSPPFTWTYHLQLTSGETIPAPGGCTTTGNNGCAFITLYDLQGSPTSPMFSPSFSLAYTMAGGSGTAGSTLSGPNPASLLPFTDNPSIPNVFVNLFGASSAVNAGSMALDLGTLSFTDALNGQGSGNYGAQANNTSTTLSGANFGTTLIPAPEPASAALLVSGLPVFVGLVAARRRGRRVHT